MSPLLDLAEGNRKAHEEHGMKISHKRETLHHLKKSCATSSYRCPPALLSASARPQFGDLIVVLTGFKNNSGPAGMSTVNSEEKKSYCGIGEKPVNGAYRT
jgi:hypothetical protein